LDFKTLKQSLLAENIFSYGLSDSHFVLIVSNSQTYKVCFQFKVRIKTFIPSQM